MAPGWLALLRPVGAPVFAPFCDGSGLSVWHVQIDLVPWTPRKDEVLSGSDNWNGKPLVVGADSGIDRSVGEVEIAARLSSDASAAAWTGKPRAPWSHFSLSGVAGHDWLQSVDSQIRRANPMIEMTSRGTPDVLRWSQGAADFCCVEYKGPSPSKPMRSDTVKPEQTAWVTSAVDRGLLTPDRIAVVTWRPSSASATILQAQALASKRGRELKKSAPAT